MAGVASNEPYHRVSKDNGVYDGALIGSAIAAGGAGAGVFGARMNYNGIERKTTRALQDMDQTIDNLSNRETRENERYNKKLDKIIDREQTYDPNSRSSGRSLREVNRFNQRKVEQPLNRLDVRHEKNLNKIRSRMDNLVDKFGDMSRPNYIASKQAGHIYSKRMGGWRNAAIIGASAVIGAGIGAAIDGANN